MVEKTYKCVVCGKEITTTSNRGKRFCSNECRNEYIRKQKAEARTELDKKIGNTPEDYAKQQIKNTLEQLEKNVELKISGSVEPPIKVEPIRSEAVTIIEPEQIEAERAAMETETGQDARKLNEHDRSILVYMKGLINGAKIWFGEDREPNEIFNKLLNGINAILDEEEVEL